MPLIPLEAPFTVFLIRSKDADGHDCYLDEPMSWGKRPSFYRTEKEAVAALKAAAEAMPPISEAGAKTARFQAEGDRIKKACILAIPIFEDHLKLVSSAREVVLKRVRELGY